MRWILLTGSGKRALLIVLGHAQDILPLSSYRSTKNPTSVTADNPDTSRDPMMRLIVLEMVKVDIVFHTAVSHHRMNGPEYRLRSYNFVAVDLLQEQALETNANSHSELLR